MDGATFDHLIKRFTATRLTRLQTLRGLAAGVAAFTGARLAAEPSEAKKNHEKKVKVCKCPTADATLCNTKKVDKDKAKKVARQACNYKGTCQAGVTSCAATPLAAGPQCTNNNDCTGGLVCISQRCTACTADFQCGSGRICLGGTCQTPPPGPGPECVNNNQCSGGLVCLGGTCQPCTLASQCPGQVCLGVSGRCVGGETCVIDDDCARFLVCETGNICVLDGLCVDDGACASFSFNAFCLLGACTEPCSSTNPCLGDFTDYQCVGGLCLFHT